MSLLSTGLRMLYQDLLALLYPEECRACGGGLAMGEEVICTHCRIKLPYTNFHLSPTGNAVHQVFWGRVPVQLAVAYLKFQENSRVQRLLHQLKYRGQEEVGELLGKWLGKSLQEHEAFLSVDVVVPIPLHRRKLQQRGYNQVAAFAREIAQFLNVPVEESALRKKKSISSQTKKNRQDRWEAMRELYAVNNAQAIKGKHVLLVDDVITTGATLEACAAALLKSGASAVSIASIAYTL